MSTRDNVPFDAATTDEHADTEASMPLPPIDLEDADDVDIVGYGVDSADVEAE